jgi:S-adenosylmethionine synthetase
MIKTAEFVSPKHPDKQCDIIADTLLAAYLKADPMSRVAIEVMGGHGHISVSGEVTSAAEVDIPAVVRSILGDGFAIHSYLTKQSPEIGRGVDAGGAGDQGIMTGYATRETSERLPLEYVLARDLCRKIYKRYPYDGKTQVTLEDGKVKTVVASFQNAKTPELLAFVRSQIASPEYIINPAGEWSLGGFDADSGLSGRKLVVDNYGPEVSIGGGSFSGKDPTKVDRSGAYMARRIAVDLLEKEHADTVSVKLAYAIGKPEPVMAAAIIDGEERKIEGYDLTPKGIRAFLSLDKVNWPATAAWGHFGWEFPWK